MSEFETMRLGELLKFQNGRLSPERSGRGKFCVYGSNGIIGRSDIANAPGPLVVIGRVGSYCGSVYFVREDCWVTDNAIQARGIGSMDNRYLYYLALHTGLNNWRNAKPAEPYEDIAGFCKSASIDEIATHDYVLIPGRYVGAADIEDDGEPIEEKLTRLRTQLLEEFDESNRLERVIRMRLQGLVNG